MKDIRPKGKGPGNPAPKKTSARRNSQRLTIMSPHEKAAADTGGVYAQLSDATRKALEVRIRNEAKIPAVQAAAVLEAVAVQSGRLSASARSEQARLTPAEVAAQGRASAAVIREALTRLDHMHPQLDALVTEAVYRARGAIVHPGDWLRAELLLLAVALEQAAKTVDALPVRTGPIPSQKAAAVVELSKEIRMRSAPKLSQKDATALAREMIEMATGG